MFELPRFGPACPGTGWSEQRNGCVATRFDYHGSFVLNLEFFQRMQEVIYRVTRLNSTWWKTAR